MGKAGGGLKQVGNYIVMSQEASMQPASKLEATHANYANPIGGAQEKEGHFHNKKNFESLEMRCHIPYLLHHPQIPLLCIGIKPNP